MGSSDGGQLGGTFGNIGTLTFYPAHRITKAEGWAVFTSNSDLKRTVEAFRDWRRRWYCAPGKANTCGRSFGWWLESLPFGHEQQYACSREGYNFEISDMQAAGPAQMDRLPDFIAARKADFAYLNERLGTLDEFVVLSEATAEGVPSWFAFPITLRNDAPAESRFIRGGPTRCWIT